MPKKKGFFSVEAQYNPTEYSNDQGRWRGRVHHSGLDFFPTTYSLGNAYPSRYAHYYRNPDAIIKCAIYWSINDDNMILDMLEKLRMISSFVS